MSLDKVASMRVELVVSAYQADLDWLKSVPEAVWTKVYDKSNNGFCWGWLKKNLFGYGKETLPNVGKLDHTFCHHIVENYDNLADWTVFCPDNAPLKIREGQNVQDLLEPSEGVKIPWIFMVRDWNTDGRLSWDRWNNRPDRNGTNWAERYHKGLIKHARLSFVEWSKLYIGFDPNSEPWPGYIPGSIFGVPKQAITYLPKGFYERLREQLSHHVEPEEGHYLERLWLVIFTGKARYLEIPTKEIFSGERKQAVAV